MILQIQKKIKIIFLANTGWYFYNFRLDFIEFLLKKDFEIHLICPSDKFSQKLIKKGLKVHNWNLIRNSTNIFLEFRSIILLYKIYKKINPDISHHFTIKGVLYGTLIAKYIGIKYIFNSITGLGNIFIGKNLKIKFLNLVILPIYKLIIKSSNVQLIFQNKYDLDYFIKLNIAKKENSFLIRGSGINIDFFKNSNKETNFPKTKYWKLLFPSRIIKEKGIIELVEACDNLWLKNKNFRLYIAGEFDKTQRSNISKKFINKIKKREYIEAIKYQTNMKDLYLGSDIVVLPSWREGLSRSLLEAGSMQIPIITTDVPGCRDIVIHNKTGLLVPKEDPQAIENAINILINNKNLCKKFRKNIRTHIIKNFTNEIVNRKTYNLYQKIIKNKFNNKK